MIKNNVANIEFNKKTYNSLKIFGVNDLGISSEVTLGLDEVMANAFRIALKMIHPYGDQILPPSKTAVFEGSCDMSYSDNLGAVGTGVSMRLYLGGTSINILTPLYDNILMSDETYKPWYESKTLVVSTIKDLSIVEALQKKLDKYFPFEQFSPINEPCYKYIKS